MIWVQKGLKNFSAATERLEDYGDKRRINNSQED
jgi:hypothetical protein